MQIHLRPSDPPELLDRVMRDFRAPGTEIVLKPGRYWTRGPWAFPAAGYRTHAGGVIVRPDGTGVSEIWLSPDAERTTSGVLRTQRDLGVWTCEPGASFLDIKIHGNEEAFRGSTLATTWYVTVGIRGFGGLTLHDWEVSGLRGGYKWQTGLPLDNEAFAVSTVGPDGGSSILRGRVTGCAPKSYVTALNIGHVGPAPAPSTVEDVEIDIAEGNWMALGVNQNVIARRVTLERGCQIGVYNDTDMTSDVLVESSSFWGCNRLVSLIAPPGTNRTGRGRIHLIRTTADLVADAEGNSRGVELWDKAASGQAPVPMGPVILDHCEIEAGGTFYGAAIAGALVRPVVYSNCVIPRRSLSSGPAGSLVISQCRDSDGNPIRQDLA